MGTFGERAQHVRLWGLPGISVVERAEGNPFLAEELLKDLLEHQETGRGPKALPLTNLPSVLERIPRPDASFSEVTRARWAERPALLGLCPGVVNRPK